MLYRNKETKMRADEHLILTVSAVLRDRRESLGMSQSELGLASGLHRSYIGDLERGSRNLALKNLCRLAEALDLTPSKVLSLAERKLEAKSTSKRSKK
jgi:transcriptional regulator with XRE-family HTH domain